LKRATQNPEREKTSIGDRPPGIICTPGGRRVSGKRLLFASIFARSLTLLIVCIYGCRKDSNPASVPPTGTDTVGRYGSGSVSFDAAGGGGQFAATGKYKPTDQFANDSMSEGAGGFVRDTSLFQRRIQGLFAGYVHRLAGGSLSERVIMISVRGDSAGISAGNYPFAASNIAQSGRSAYVYFFFSNPDSLAYYDLYVPRSGTLTISSFDPSARHARGAFSGTLWGPSPDTLKLIQVTQGQFDISYVTAYFNP